MKLVCLIIALLSLLCTLSGASLYPTQPIAKTIFRAGTWNSITWIDSGETPKLNEHSNFEIHLWNRTNQVAVLATNVSALQMRQEVFIHKRLGSNTPYTLRFKFENPPETVYSADFTIVGLSDVTGEASGDSCSFSGSSTLTSGTCTSATPPVSGMNDIVTVTMEIQSSSISAPFPESTSESETLGAIANAASNTRRHSRKFNLQFNIVFVFFPALFGLTLAL